ncbi:iron-siderophore ABC transporter substrate-binding protein [Mycobacterium sp. CVI_P3]|uniref:Iron-siderophore ABC transporter substrate-binding protein n=1 Tax=Mycobacterium pinniadriaticum TaxID=2994102 RepID=A0ABT3SLF2_9MYCO|nr:iron-siderophore ABC transporter substrate-binding protein [Mycobacterium pinniadriaticum]MCX2933932.1 iron-siderophore ABC transporter substrate-binding protein [Mycobacterium pinniadriaticum]MCX2940354.1 iron-siderophore ABC transporter substrate-binding protein [Mycobacterium pinniadriaticum]
MLIGGKRSGVVMAAGAVLAAVAMTVASGCSGSSKSPAPAASPDLITSTTKIAGAGVLGNQRRPDESCAPDPARLDPVPPGPIRHATGETTVVADPQRIVVLAGDELDALCALGLQSRIVAAALPDGATGQPSYLGTVIHDLPGVGTRSSPDLAAIAAANPDLILGSQALTPQSYQALSAIAPTVFTDAPGAQWQDNLRTTGAATGRAEAAGDLIGEFTEKARQKGVAVDAAHFQASIVQFTDTTMRVYGAQNFPASVLADVGVDRPAAQRFTDKPYIEIGISDADLEHSPDLSPADGDIVYLSFASQAAKDRAPAILDSAPWRKLSANRDNRVFIVNNEVWQTGQGIVAARGILDDLRWLNAPIN